MSADRPEGIAKVEADSSSTGAMGQRYLAGGESVAMRLWVEHDSGGEPKAPAARDYETVGYVISGRAELLTATEVLPLGPGESWLVPRGVEHTYRIVEAFTAVEATSPPARVGGRDRA